MEPYHVKPVLAGSLPTDYHHNLMIKCLEPNDCNSFWVVMGLAVFHFGEARPGTIETVLTAPGFKRGLAPFHGGNGSLSANYHQICLGSHEEMQFGAIIPGPFYECEEVRDSLTSVTYRNISGHSEIPLRVLS